MESNKKDDPETSQLGHDSSSLIFPDLREANKEFEKSLAGLEEAVKLLKSDIEKPLSIDISDPDFPSSSINASPEK
jgi:hypothetical protein